MVRMQSTPRRSCRSKSPRTPRVFAKECRCAVFVGCIPCANRRSFHHQVLLRSQGVTDGPINQQCSLDQLFVQVPLRQRGVFTYSRREGRTGDQKTSRRYYRSNDLRSSHRQLMKEAPRLPMPLSRGHSHRLGLFGRLDRGLTTGVTRGWRSRSGA